MLSRKTKYALQAVLLLARKVDQGPILISDIASQESIPKKFLELILLDLKAKGIVQSKKGKGGGYYLAKDPSEISFGQIIRATEGPLALVPCVSKTAYGRCEGCHDEETCGIRAVMAEVRDETARVLDNTTLADVLERISASLLAKNETVMYYI